MQRRTKIEKIWNNRLQATRAGGMGEQKTCSPGKNSAEKSVMKGRTRRKDSSLHQTVPALGSERVMVMN